MKKKDAYQKFGDVQLVAMLKAGDHTAFAEILNRYFTLLFSFAYRRLEDREQARDLVQDVFVTIWEKREQLVIEGILEAYLVLTIKNRVLDYYRHTKVSRAYIEKLGAYLNDPNNNTDHLVRHNDLNALIEREIAALPEKMRLVYELSRKQSMNRQEMSEHLKMPENTVKTNLQRALRILRNKLLPGSRATLKII